MLGTYKCVLAGAPTCADTQDPIACTLGCVPTGECNRRRGQRLLEVHPNPTYTSPYMPPYPCISHPRPCMYVAGALDRNSSRMSHGPSTLYASATMGSMLSRECCHCAYTECRRQASEPQNSHLVAVAYASLRWLWCAAQNAGGTTPNCSAFFWFSSLLVHRFGSEHRQISCKVAQCSKHDQ